jgi:hypothetical protein
MFKSSLVEHLLGCILIGLAIIRRKLSVNRNSLSTAV